MTVRSPLVLGPDGLAQQLQSGDSISSPTNTPSIRSVSNGDSVALVFGAPVYASAADTVKRAQANAKSTSKVTGLVYDPTVAASANGNIAQSGVMVGTTAQWDAVVTGENGGLSFNGTYFLDPANVGKLTTAPPTTAGQCNVVIGTAISPTELELQIAQPILL